MTLTVRGSDPDRSTSPGRSWLLAVALLAACGGGGGGTGGTAGSAGAELVAVEFGRLVDVYGLRTVGDETTVELFETDVLVGPDIRDERDANSTKRDDEISYDFLASNPDTLQPRLLITRELGSAAFAEKFDLLDEKVRRVSPARFGQDVTTQPFSVVPRNGGLRLRFTRPLGLDEDFFVARDPVTKIVTGVKNSEAVQLLRIVGDPNDQQHSGDFQVVPARIVPKGNTLIVDPVLLGSEGRQYQARNNAAGMPESPDQSGANMRLAVALEGPLAIPGIKPDRSGGLDGRNNQAQRSVIRDFRSGNVNDSSADVSRGFVRDPVPPRVVGEITMYLERVDDLNSASQVLRVYKGGIQHEIDRGDVIRLVVDNSGIPAAVTEVTVDPDGSQGDRGDPSVQHVNVIVRRTPGLEEHDPSRRPDYPLNERDREPWLVKNAPKAVLVCEFTAERIDPKDPTKTYGDDERYFLTFTPSPLPHPDGTPSEPNQNVSPFAGAILRFTKPVDMSTVKAFDTFFFGTRDLLDPQAVEDFKAQINIEPSAFRHEKFLTPHLVTSQVYDEDGSQTAVRLQPKLGFYLDETIRTTDEPKEFKDKKFKYFVHLRGGDLGIRDLAGNEIDFQSALAVREQMTIPFSLDTRKLANGQPQFADNLAVSIVRRLAGIDEDEQPSYYRSEEVQQKGITQPNPLAYNLEDMFGSVNLLSDGTIEARPTTRVRQVVDNLNQAPPPSQKSDLRYCPEFLNGEEQVASGSAVTPFGQPLQNPLNPFGCRLQMLWREIDMSLSRTEPGDFNLDVEYMHWAPFAGNPITFDEFDTLSLYLGHSEYRPEPCVGITGALPTMPGSGLAPAFAENYVANKTLTAQNEAGPAPHAAFIAKNMPIEQRLAITEPNGVNRYLPLPKFDKPYFVWRDELNTFQGANAGVGSDVTPSGLKPYIISPFLNGGGRFVKFDTAANGLKFFYGFWNNAQNFNPGSTSSSDQRTGGLVGSIALPLLADFQVLPDSETLPEDNPFRASGANGWQISIALTSGAQPNFRVYSGGGLVQGKPREVKPGLPDWNNATGGYTPNGARTPSGDNSVFWIMTDFLKRQSVATFGFVELANPHRLPKTSTADPRLGPYFGGTPPANMLPRFDLTFEPPLEQLPGGTAVVPEFRGAGIVDPSPWYATKHSANVSPPPDADNFPLDPRKAGDAHIRKYDDRGNRGAWTYFYNRQITGYTKELNELMDPNFTSRFQGPTETFTPADVKYFNWRFIMLNNVDANPPIAPRLQSFAITYRFERR
jgi:hypothetical protein